MTSAIFVQTKGNRASNVEALVSQLILEVGTAIGGLYGRLALAADDNFVTNDDLTIAAVSFTCKTQVDVGNADAPDHVTGELDFMTLNVGLASIVVRGDADARAKLAEWATTQPAVEQFMNGDELLMFAWNVTSHADAAKVIARGSTGIPVPHGPVICPIITPDMFTT